MSSPQSAPVTFWYHHWSPRFHPSVGRIRVQPGADGNDCREAIRECEKNIVASTKLDLYTIPESLDVPLSSLELEATLGSLSPSQLGLPLAVHLPVARTLGLKLKQDCLHLIAVNIETPLIIYCWIHGMDTSSILELTMPRKATVQALFLEIRAKCPTLQDHHGLTFYKASPEEFGTGNIPKGQPLLNVFITLDRAFSDIPFSKLPCVIVERAYQEPKRHLLWDIVERAKKYQERHDTSPSMMAAAAYHDLQSDANWRLLDYRTPLRNLDEILFHGFGEFLDTWRVVYTPGLEHESVTPALQDNVDSFIDSMSLIYNDEESRCQAALHALNAILSPVVGPWHRVIAASDATSESHDADTWQPSSGHYLYGPHRIPCIVVKFKNENTASTAPPVVELAGHYNQMITDVARNMPKIVESSRLPALGITISGPIVTFFALAFVGSVVYVPLTTSLWCLPIQCGGSDRHQFYSAFAAASSLLTRIEDEAKALSSVPLLRQPIKRPFYPQLNSLVEYEDPNSHLTFQITEILEKSLLRHVYKASTGSGFIVVKFVRSYSPQMHQFCAQLGHAPKFLSAQKLPGGFTAIAMEYLEGYNVGSGMQTRISPERCNNWVHQLQGLVKAFHDAKFVHGDLRPPNIFCFDDKIMLLDFDWGGKIGEAFYPHHRLNPQLTEGRDMLSLEITKEDDIRVLQSTVQHIRDHTS